jgi:hypothetical protein
MSQIDVHRNYIYFSIFNTLKWCVFPIQHTLQDSLKGFRDIMEFVIGMQADGNPYKYMKLVSRRVVPLVNGLVCVAIVMNLWSL